MIRTELWLISGRVQGVGFRDWMVQEARSVDLKGWVRNHPDGYVEALVSGGSDVLESFLQRCKTGPRLARVTDIARHTHDPAKVAVLFCRK